MKLPLYKGAFSTGKDVDDSDEVQCMACLSQVCTLYHSIKWSMAMF